VTLKLLFSAGEAHMPWDGNAVSGPIVRLADYLPTLRKAEDKLRKVAIDDMIGFFDHVAREWVAHGHPVAAVIAKMGIGFLPLWMRSDSVGPMVDVACRGQRAVLDKFTLLATQRSQLFRAQPRGLVVHWVAGNVAVLGMISAIQALLTKNASLIKAPSNHAGLLPFLFSHMAKTSWKNPAGRIIDGRAIADAIIVLHAERDDLTAAREISTAADVRVAWGGREAVETIMNLPRRFGTEDIIFGPKVSFAVVGREHLSDVHAASKIAEKVARDCAINDQHGCNSPHTVFVEANASVSPREFSSLLANALASIGRRLPLTEVAPADAMKVLTKRVEYEMCGDAFYSSGMGWTVLFDPDKSGLGEPCYLRTLYVRQVEDVFSLPKLCSIDTQTVGLALIGDRRLALAEGLTAQGIERCVEVGSMSLYDTPWDGMFPMSRMVRWVSLK
jgi:Acyl-CoA reductase (LuxC)